MASHLVGEEPHAVLVGDRGPRVVGAVDDLLQLRRLVLHADELAALEQPGAVERVGDAGRQVGEGEPDVVGVGVRLEVRGDLLGYIDKDEADVAAKPGERAEVSAEGKAEEGQFSIDAPGFEMKVEIPSGIASRAKVESDGDDGDIVYPGSTLSGLHVEGGRKGEGGSAVELRFTSGDTPERIAAWYRDPARTEISVASATREGGDHVIQGTRKEDGEPFSVRLSPRSGGGTDARVMLVDRS